MRWPWSPRRSAQRLLLRRVGEQHAFVLTDGPPGDEPARLLGDAAAKRRLWIALRTLRRSLAAAGR